MGSNGIQSVVALMFHGLCRELPAYARFPGTKTCLIEESDFRAIIGWCAKRYRIISLSELEATLHEKSSSPAMILTFDDGLASFIDLAMPILEEFSAPCINFITTDWINQGRTPAVFALERLIWEERPGKLEISVGETTLEVERTKFIDPGDSVLRIWSFLFDNKIPPLKLRDDQIKVDGRPWERNIALDHRHFWYPATWEELRKALDTGLVEYGSHTMTHTPLSWLSEQEIDWELSQSREQLSRQLGVAVKSCSYPHGFADDRVYKAAGSLYEWSFAGSRGKIDLASSPLTLPRFHVDGRKPGLIKYELEWGRSVQLLRRILSQVRRLK